MSSQAFISNASQSTLAAVGDGYSVPRMPTAQRLAIVFTTADQGMMVYDTTLNNLFIWNGTAWESIPGSGDAGANGSVQYNDNGIVSGATNFVYDKATDQVGIGTATPIYKLHAVVTSGAVAKFGASTAAIARLLVGNTVGDLEVKINANADGQITSDAGKYLGLGSNSSNDRVILTTTGNLSITNGNVVMATSGKGIDFSAVTGGTGTATANVLNDYEEGTFTPVISTGATAVTYSVQFGKYTKVGRLVEIHIQITTTAATRDANQFIIGGLPFSSSNFGSGVIGYSNSGFVSTAGGNKPNLYVSLTGVEFYTSAGGSFAGTTIANDAFDLRFSATYFV